MTPPIRLIPSAPWQRTKAGDEPWVAWFEDAAVCELAARPGVQREGCYDARLEGTATRVVATKAALMALAAELRANRSPLGQLLEDALVAVPAWQLRSRSLPLDRPYVMGIVNLTDDSFSGDGVGRGVDAALQRAEELRRDGADIIDVGAETARADRPVVDPEAEAALIGPAVGALVREGHVVSADTYKPLVARAALDAGAEIVNDISGLTLGIGAAGEAARAGAGYVLNYSYSVPKRRPDSPPVYADVVAETLEWMFERTAALFAAGLSRAQVAVDPGIAFGKSHDEDIQVLRRLGELESLGLPVLLAHSRKNFIGSVTGRPPTDRDAETHAATVLAYAQGARIFRVHDAAGARRALDMAAAILAAPPGAFAPDATSWPWRAGASAAHMTRAAPDKQAPGGQRW
ncbi:MAG: dihydropteroate synthase [Chloroflexi bacterium]|nr:dihydropteroate synthase [Chloroflexota bacterium]